MTTKQRQPRVTSKKPYVDRIVLAYNDRERLRAAQRQFTSTLDINDWEDLGKMVDSGLFVVMSWGSGIELIAPFRDDSIISEHLRNRGEGLFSVACRVGDMDHALAHVRSHGGVAVDVGLPDFIAQRFEGAREAFVGELGGIRVLLAKFDPRSVGE